MSGGGWNGGRWSPDLAQGPSGYNGPGETPPFHEWQHLTVDEQIQRGKDWREQHSTSLQSPGSFHTPAPTSSSAPDRSSSPHALEPRASQPGPITAAPKLPSTASYHPDTQLGAQRELRFGGHRTPGHSPSTHEDSNGQAFNRRAVTNWHPGVPQEILTQSVSTRDPRPDPAALAEPDSFAVPAPVADNLINVPEQRQGFYQRESSFDEDFKRWESEVIYGQPPVPTSHVLVPRVPAPGRSTTPFYVSSPPAPIRNNYQSIASQASTSQPLSSIPLHALEGLSIQHQSGSAPEFEPQPFTAHPEASAVYSPRRGYQTSSLDAPNHPIAAYSLPESAETVVAIESEPVHPEPAGEPVGSTKEIGDPSDDPAVHLTIRDVEARIGELEFQPLAAPVKERSPPPSSDTEGVSSKTARNRAKKAKQRERNKLKKAAAAELGGDTVSDDTVSDTMKEDGKRKATEDPASPVAAKRVKHDDSAEPPAKPKMAVIPFPEKVFVEPESSLSLVESILTLLSACPSRGAQR